MERAPVDSGAQPPHNEQELRIRALEQAVTGIELEIRQLRQHMNDGFALLKEALHDVRRLLAELSARMDRQDARLDRMDVRLDRMDARLDRMDARMDRMEGLMRWAIGLQLATILGVLGGGATIIGILLQRLS